ncbi:MAG: hydroxymethylbilane synthase [Dehalococcoidia bacterium]
MTREASRRLVIGTRGSTLALKQVDIVTEALMSTNSAVEVERLIIRTEGDRRTDVTLEQLGGQGVFVKDIEGRLLAGEIDIAVHSLKDMPAQSPDGLVIGAVLPRADVRDVLISRNNLTLAELPSGARIGTDSRRRAVQLQAMRPDVGVESIRGNVDSRIRKVAEGLYDAVVLAAAGLERLGMLDRASQIFTTDQILPAIGQGVLAVQCRAEDVSTLEQLRAIDDSATRYAITAERAFLARLGAGCRLPVAAYATLNEGKLSVRGFVATETGLRWSGATWGFPADAEALGAGLAESLGAEAGIIPEVMEP